MHTFAQHGVQKFSPQPFKNSGRLRSPGPEFDMCSTASLGRSQIERYIAEQFSTVYGASITEFMPNLLTMRCLGKLSAVVGLRAAGMQGLFLDSYFPRPIEQVIADKADCLINRNKVLEIGNLVATHRGSSQLLFVVLAEILKQASFEWVVVTATPQVEKSLRRLGIEIYILGDADPGLLPESSTGDWGSYYDSKPKVMAGRVCPELIEPRSGKKLAAILPFYQREVKALAANLNNQRFL